MRREDEADEFLRLIAEADRCLRSRCHRDRATGRRTGTDRPHGIPAFRQRTASSRAKLWRLCELCADHSQRRLTAL
nr:hypothetical protein [Gluconacetobacter sacchari]